MKLRTTILTLTGALALTPPVSAQTAQPAPATSPPAASSSFTDGDLQKFATAAIALNKIQADTNVAPADKQPKMVAAVQQSGLDPQKFNAIAQAAQNDPALQQRIQTAAAAAQPQQAPQQPQN